MDEQVRVLLRMMERAGDKCADRARVLAEGLDVPYLEEREVDGKRGPRAVKHFEGGSSNPSGELLPGEADNSPHCFLDAPKALVRLGDKKLEGLYFHFPTMNLVLVTSDDRIGVQMMWLIRGGWRVLVERLVEGKVSN